MRLLKMYICILQIPFPPLAINAMWRPDHLMLLHTPTQAWIGPDSRACLNIQPQPGLSSPFLSKATCTAAPPTFASLSRCNCSTSEPHSERLCRCGACPQTLFSLTGVPKAHHQKVCDQATLPGRCCVTSVLPQTRDSATLRTPLRCARRQPRRTGRQRQECLWGRLPARARCSCGSTARCWAAG